MKDYNARIHYKMKHQSYTSYTGTEREQRVKQQTASLLAQQQQFFRTVQEMPQRLAASLKVAGILCPEKTQENSCPMSRRPVS